jgi:hypothetical protein
MAKNLHKLMVAVLSILLSVGALAEVALSVETCFPKACCCAKAASSQPYGHDGHAAMEMPLGCTPQIPDPCCKVKPHRPKAQLAISSTPYIVPYKLFTTLSIPASTCQTPVRLTNFSSYIVDGPPKIPLVAIYLQTQTFLC